MHEAVYTDRRNEYLGPKYPAKPKRIDKILESHGEDNADRPNARR
jgi:hypothetical protein